MIKEAIGTGNTLEEAKEAALMELCAGETDDIRFDIISFPKKKTLGLFGGALAQVRAYVEVPDKKPAKSKKPEHKKQNNDNKQKADKKPANKKAHAPKEEATAVIPEGVSVEELDKNGNAYKAVTYLKTVLRGLGCEGITFTVVENEDGAIINLTGDNTGVIIGHRGETLDALQYLTSLASTKKGSGYYRVTLNIGNYRQKREQTLEGVAKKTASQVLRTGRSRSLEPMNPYERRIIHTTIQKIDGVTSNSIGGGSGRRVVISPDENFKKAQKPAEKPATKSDSASTPLYGRIN